MVMMYLSLTEQKGEMSWPRAARPPLQSGSTQSGIASSIVDYGQTTEEHNVSYHQLYPWVKIYDKSWIYGLDDHR